MDCGPAAEEPMPCHNPVPTTTPLIAQEATHQDAKVCSLHDICVY